MTVSLSSYATIDLSSAETITISSGTVSVTSGVISLSSGPPVYPTPAASGGLTAFSITNSSSGTNSTLVTTAACQVYGVELFNTTNAPAFLRLYSLSTAPTAGTSSYTQVFAAPTVGSTIGGITTTTYASFNNYGVPYASGLGFTLTGAITSTDATAVGSSVYIINLYYK